MQLHEISLWFGWDSLPSVNVITAMQIRWRRAQRHFLQRLTRAVTLVWETVPTASSVMSIHTLDKRYLSVGVNTLHHYTVFNAV